MKLIPQEVELWYVYPSLRKEIASIMAEEYFLKQKDIAKKLKVTKAAVSNYLNKKRSKKEIFDNSFKIEIEKSVKRIMDQQSETDKEIQSLFSLIRKNKTLCKIHRMFDDKVPKECGVCYEK